MSRAERAQPLHHCMLGMGRIEVRVFLPWITTALLCICSILTRRPLLWGPITHAANLDPVFSNYLLIDTDDSSRLLVDTMDHDIRLSVCGLACSGLSGVCLSPGLLI